MEEDNERRRQDSAADRAYEKSFDGVEILKDISLSVREGEVVSIIGPSGSGKSTLLRCATMLETMDGGTLSYLSEKAAYEEMADAFMHQRQS